jgi:hypothetical protein
MAWTRDQLAAPRSSSEAVARLKTSEACYNAQLSEVM